jgi:hypothetical protein
MSDKSDKNDNSDNSEISIDPFDPAALRLDASLTTGVKKLLTVVPVRKPNPQDFVRVNPDPAFRLDPAAIIEVREDRGETYLLTPAMANELRGEFSLAAIYTAINRQGVLFLWPVKLPSSDGKILGWHSSAAQAAELAMSRWVRVKSNMSLGAYETFQAPPGVPEPEWPKDISFPEILKIAFRGRYIDALHHPLVQRLQGAA